MQRLTEAFSAGRLIADGEPEGYEPEQILVLEIAGELTDFVNAVGRIPGLEFLAEELEDKVEPDEFAAVDREGKRHGYKRQLFLIASDYTAWQQLLNLWERFKRDEDFGYGLAQFRHLFSRLRDLRPWDDRDRLERTGALSAWERELSDLDDELVEFEAELWLRRDAARRARLVEELRTDLESAGGELMAESIHEQIDYHGILGRVPARLLRSAVERREVQWLRTGSVRFFHATGQIAAVGSGDAPTAEADVDPGSPRLDRSPRIALLDGVPLSNHASISNRVVVDDPEDWEEVTPVQRRVHGTGMASLVLNGDLSGENSSLGEPIYIRPILKADAPSWVTGDVREELPRDRLAVDVIQAAVARLFEGDAVAPDVKVIVLAVGDSVQQFDRFVSPLARILDWLSERYGVLIVVSAGNHLEGLALPGDVDLENPEELQHEVLCALQQDGIMRRVLAPGEAVNALTVGAAHSDASEATVDDGRREPMLVADLPNVVSALGSGARRSIKPDVLFPGGRQTLRVEPSESDEPHRLSISVSRRPPGVKMATVGTDGGNLTAACFATGTSAATALAGNRAGHLLGDLDQLREVHGDKMPSAEFDGVLVKAALAHGAAWGAAHALIDSCQEDLERGRSRAAVARLVGYGNSGFRRSLACDEHQATAIGAGRLIGDKADVFRLPLPESLASKTISRRVKLTLAWITPINASHRHYRRAALKVEAVGFPAFLGRRANADANAVARGTLQHEIFESDQATPYQAGNAMELVVSCRADAGSLSASVPYALIATVEVGEGIGLPIYEEVREGLAVPVQVRTR